MQTLEEDAAAAAADAGPASQNSTPPTTAEEGGPGSRQRPVTIALGESTTPADDDGGASDAGASSSSSSAAAAAAAVAGASGSGSGARTISQTKKGNTTATRMTIGSRTFVHMRDAKRNKAYSSVSMLGWMRKRGGRMKTWKDRWFVIRNSVLYYYKSQVDTTLLMGHIILPEYSVKEDASDETDRENSFCLVKENARTYVFQAKDAKSRLKWIKVLSEATGKDRSEVSDAHVEAMVACMLAGKPLPLQESFADTPDKVVIAEVSKSTTHGEGEQEGEEEAEEEEVILILENQLVAAANIQTVVDLLFFRHGADPQYVATFFLCFRHVMTAPEVMARMIECFDTPPVDPRDRVDGGTATEESATEIRFRIVQALQLWVESHWYDFHVHPELVEDLEALLERASDLAGHEAVMKEMGKEMKATIKKSKSDAKAAIKAYRKRKEEKEEGGSSLSKKAKKRSLINFVTQVDSATDFADEITRVDQAMLEALRPEAFTLQLWGTYEGDEYVEALKDRLDELVERFNFISSWVGSEIVLKPDQESRVSALKALVDVGARLLELENYNALMAVVSGLNSAAIQRLKRVWAALPSSKMAVMTNLELVMDPQNNYGAYRNRNKPLTAIPFVGLYLKDLTFQNDGNPKRVENRLTNVDKWRHINRSVRSVLAFASQSLGLPRKKAAEKYLAVAQILDDNTLYEFSLLAEPRVKKAKAGEGGEEGGGQQPMRLIEKWAAENK